MISRPTCLALLAAAAAASLLSPTVTALPSGAVSCPLGVAAPEGNHGSGTFEQVTTLEEGGFTVTLDGDLVVGETRMITLSGERVFRGFLVRLEGDGELEPIGTESQVATACGGVPGVVRTAGCMLYGVVILLYCD